MKCQEEMEQDREDKDRVQAEPEGEAVEEQAAALAAAQAPDAWADRSQRARAAIAYAPTVGIRRRTSAACHAIRWRVPSAARKWRGSSIVTAQAENLSVRQIQYEEVQKCQDSMAQDHEVWAR